MAEHDALRAHPSRHDGADELLGGGPGELGGKVQDHAEVDPEVADQPHLKAVGLFVDLAASLVKPGGLLFAATLNRTMKSFALAILGAEYILRWLPRGTHQWEKFITPDELAKYLLDSRLVVTEQTGVVFNPFADKWGLSSDTDVNYMVIAEEMV